MMDFVENFTENCLDKHIGAPFWGFCNISVFHNLSSLSPQKFHDKTTVTLQTSKRLLHNLLTIKRR